MALIKKSFLCLLSALLLLSPVWAAGEDTDPAISESYLQAVFSGAFLEEVSQETSQAMDALEARTLQGVEQQLAASAMTAGGRGVSNNGSGILYTAAQDVVDVILGAKITPVEGELRAQTTGWIDVTTGSAVQEGEVMAIGHTYISSEEACSYLTHSTTGSVSYSGGYTLYRSGEVNFASRAEALAALGLFKGGTTGFELTRSATRTEALVMFLRILGREEAALASAAANPFSDMPSWATKYAAYAYEQKLIQGLGNGVYNANATVTAQDYLTMLLRALGFNEGTDFTWSTVLDDALSLGILTAAERSYLQNNPFTRAQMAYLSWQVLMSQNISEQLLLCQLRDDGVVSRDQIAAAIHTVCGSRIN